MHSLFNLYRRNTLDSPRRLPNFLNPNVPSTRATPFQLVARSFTARSTTIIGIIKSSLHNHFILSVSSPRNIGFNLLRNGSATSLNLRWSIRLISIGSILSRSANSAAVYPWFFRNSFTVLFPNPNPKIIVSSKIVK